MTVQKSINLALAMFIATLGAALMLVVANVSAQEGETQEAVPVTTQAEESTETTEESTTEATTVSNYDYVAQPGDSYSLMARKAVQTYGINNSINLSGAQIIFVETNLTKAAGSPVLNLGQNVSIDGNLVSEWVEKAQALTEEQQALWQPYANNANFNTDAVGQPAN
jgi:hypothetical protein